MMRYLKGWDSRPFWRDTDGNEYCRVAGGLAWSHGELPGWLVVLGEDRAPRSDGRRHISVVHAWEARDPVDRAKILSPREIMLEAAALSVSLFCAMWISPGDLPDATLAAAFNRERGPRETRLTLRTPPRYEHGKAFAVYDRLLEHRARERSFHMGEAGKALKQEYSILGNGDRARPLEDFPATAAMLYALAWLEFMPAPYAGTENVARRVNPVGIGGVGY